MTPTKAGVRSCITTIWLPWPDQVRVTAGTILRNGPAVPGCPRPDQASPDDDAPDRRRAGGRGAARGTRGAQLRSRVCERALALRLSLRLAQGADTARRVVNAGAVRRARRPLAPCLPSAMVSVRER